MSEDSSETDSSEVTGSYQGTTINMVATSSKNGQTMLRCLNCNKRVSKNYGSAKDHTCGDGADGSPYQCCEAPVFEDVWVERESSGNGTFKERMKECQNCGERLGLAEYNPEMEAEDLGGRPTDG